MMFSCPNPGDGREGMDDSKLIHLLLSATVSTVFVILNIVTDICGNKATLL